VRFATVCWDWPEHAETPTQPARVFVRPHDFEVHTERNGSPSFKAVVTHVHSAGPNVRLELVAESGERLYAELPQDRYLSENISKGAEVFVTPQRIRVFADDREIGETPVAKRA
jgi:sulfate transport system ATP-binding protein